MYDIIIIGAGPAGITAAVYAARKKLKTLVITENIVGQAALSGEIDNYTDFQFITGPELALKFEEHLKKFDVELREFTKVKSIEKIESIFKVYTEDNIYKAHSVIIANGTQSKKLNVSGEVEFKNRGVTYCATCDAPLFEGKDVAVIGGGNSALDAALQLISIANKIYIINILPELTGDQSMRDTVRRSEKVTIMNTTSVVEISGTNFVESIIVKQGNKNKKIDVQGVFIEIGLEAKPILVKTDNGEILELNNRNEIIINKKCETSVKGLFAAGDITDTPFKQIIAAAGQGCIACLSAYEYLTKNSLLEV